jgi:23S rRNA pseudouridine1911/1915/1917 synthase
VSDKPSTTGADKKVGKKVNKKAEKKAEKKAKKMAEKKAGKHKNPRPPQSKQRPFIVVYEDADLLVANKAPGILTVPIPGKSSKNLKELLDDYLVRQKRVALPVHRIDRHTSGLVVFAKNKLARELLVEQFKARTPERTYLTMVRGQPEEDEGTLRHYLKLIRDGFRQVVVKSGGTPAITHYKVLERLGDVTLLEVKLESGLKNQIRVQFQAAGHTLVGDQHYDPAEHGERHLNRQALHAWKLAFIHPRTKRLVHFESELAPDMAKLLAKLEKRREKSRKYQEKKRRRGPKQEDTTIKASESKKAGESIK